MVAILRPMLSADDESLENISAAPRHSVPKWPFLLGDAVLVIAALAVWFSSDGLSTTGLFFCLGSVVMGALIFVTPYALESFPPASWRIFAGDSAGSDPDGLSADGAGEWRRQARAAAEAVEHAARANAALESSARRFDSRFAPLVEVHQSLTAVVAEMREAATARAATTASETLALQREFERLRKEQAEKFKAAEEKIAALSETLAVLAAQPKLPIARHVPTPDPEVATTRTRAKTQNLSRVEEPALVGVGAAAAEAVPAAEAAPIHSELAPTPAVEAATLANTETPSLGAISIATPEAEMPITPQTESVEEKSMLAKAFARSQSSSQTPAVAGIIMARARRQRKSKAPMAVISPDQAPAAEGNTETPAVTEGEGWQALTEEEFAALSVAAPSSTDETVDRAIREPEPAKVPEPAEGDTSSAFRRSARAKAVALRGEEEEAARKDTPVVFTPGRPEESATPLTDGPTQGELLAREAETIRKKRSSRSPVSACALTARVLIGIGNKPFVRGTGPGLSNEKGVPMEFVEIGQWRWVAPTAVKEPIAVRILKNDEVPAEGNPIVLHPGQSLEVSPVFPG